MALRPVTPVGILAATLERVAAEVDGLDGASEELRADAARALALARGLDPYLEACTTPASPALDELERRTNAEDWGEDSPTGLEPEMLSGHVEGQLLKLLVHVTRARRVLELGLFTGSSALAMAEALPEGGELVACEVDPRAAAFARSCLDASPAGARVRIEVAPALATLSRLAADADAVPFDLVFVDADKPGYAGYLDAVLDGGLLAPHGLLCVDNTLMQGEPWLDGERSANGEAIAAFNAAVAADARVEQVLVPLRDGVTLIRHAP